MTATALESTPPTPTLAAGAKHLAGRLPAPDSRSGWAGEVAVFPARSLFDLPVPPVLTLHVPGVEGLVRIELHPDSEDDDGAIRFDADEWRALVVATEADRLWPHDLAHLCQRKRLEPSVRVRLADALAGGQPDPRERWNVSRVLARWEVQLVSVDLVS